MRKPLDHEFANRLRQEYAAHRADVEDRESPADQMEREQRPAVRDQHRAEGATKPKIANHATSPIGVSVPTSAR